SNFMDAPVPPDAPELRSPAPLLPPALLGPAALFWLWVLPVAVLLLLNLQGYWLIAGNMDARQSAAAHIVGLAGMLNLVAGLALCAVTARTHRLADPV